MTRMFRILLLCGLVSVVLSSSNVLSSNDTSSENKTKKEEEHASIHLATIKFDYVKQPLIIAVFIFAAGIAKLAFHHAEFISSRVPESCLLIILGIIVGAIMSQTTESSACKTFNESVDYHEEQKPAISMTSSLFFLCLLPPIILESAYSLHDRTFFENVGSVIIFAVIGTVLNCFLIGPTLFGASALGAMGSLELELKPCLVFSAIIVAVDPVAVLAIFQEVGVNNVLYFLVFGESLFNDAVTVVLYNMMQEFNKMEHVPLIEVVKGLVSFFIVSLGGLFIGIFFGVLTAIITKYTGTVRVVEPLAVFVLAYISYLVAELFHFSGIISLIGCGLMQAHYAFHNISQKSRTTITYFSKMQSSLSDCMIFLFLGIGLFNCEILNPNHWSWQLILWTLLLCLLYRFIVVFGLTWIINRSNRMRKILNVEKFIMAYGGLRGAVAFSLVDLLEHGDFQKNTKDMFMTTCLALIFFTVFVQGISIKPLVRFLQINLQEEKDLKLSEEINTHVIDHVMAGIEEILGEHGENYLREILEYYNRKYFKNWLMKDPISIDEQIMSCFEEIALQQHFENLQGSAMINSKYGNLDFPWLHQEENGVQEEMSDDEVNSNNSDDLVLPAVTIDQPLMPKQLPSGYWEEEDERLKQFLESKLKHSGAKRKSIVPAFLRTKQEISQEPTAQELKSVFIPSYREVRHRKLDKNLKDESSADLLRYLRDKQSRNRRMSRAVFKDSKTNTPLGSNKALHHRGVVENYKRRLSLAVPERPRFQRGRSPSDVTNLRGANLESFMDGNALVPNPILKPIGEVNQKHCVENETGLKKSDRHQGAKEKRKRLQKSKSESDSPQKQPFLEKTKSIFQSISEEDSDTEESKEKHEQRPNSSQGHTESNPDLSTRDGTGVPNANRKPSYNKAMSDPTSETVELKSYKKKED